MQENRNQRLNYLLDKLSSSMLILSHQQRVGQFGGENRGTTGPKPVDKLPQATTTGRYVLIEEFLEFAHWGGGLLRRGFSGILVNNMKVLKCLVHFSHTISISMLLWDTIGISMFVTHFHLTIYDNVEDDGLELLLQLWPFTTIIGSVGGIIHDYTFYKLGDILICQFLVVHPT